MPSNFEQKILVKYGNNMYFLIPVHADRQHFCTFFTKKLIKNEFQNNKTNRKCVIQEVVAYMNCKM